MNDCQFVKSLRKNEPDNLVLPKAFSKSMEALLDADDKIGQLKMMAIMLRQEITEFRKWSFDGNFDDFANPPMLQFFLTHLFFGHHVHSVSGICNKDVTKTVDVACQFLIQTSCSDRQVKHKPKKELRFQQAVQTLRSIGLPLTIHSRVRDKNLMNNLSEVYISCDYKVILDLEKCIEQVVLQRTVRQLVSVFRIL